MQKDIFDRVLEEGYYIAHTGATVRKTAEVFHFSKSTVHKDVTDRLYRIDKALYEKVKTVLDDKVLYETVQKNAFSDLYRSWDDSVKVAYELYLDHIKKKKEQTK